jgi:hypothetical protein
MSSGCIRNGDSPIAGIIQLNLMLYRAENQGNGAQRSDDF